MPYTDLNITPRTLLGPGPSDVHPRVLSALSYPLVGHMDPQFIDLMNEVQDLLRFVFETENELTIPVSGTGSAGMEAALCNFIEPGDQVLIGVNGYFGERLCDMAGRYGAEITRIERPWGEVFTVDEIDAALAKKPAKIVALVHGETSTGARQPLGDMADVVHRHGGLLLVDTVASLAGVPVGVDANDLDIVYSGSQKALSAPPGLAPLTISPRAQDVLNQRSSQVANWYLDLTMVRKYWGPQRAYHHTAPINMNYALREALRLVYEEGLAARFSRHQSNAELLWAGLEEMGMSMHVPRENRLHTLTTVRLPDGIDEAAVRKSLLNDYDIEIAGGLGALAGKVWRIGLMGYSSQHRNVTLVLAALKEVIGG
ncbi:MAG: alanine--glyoxylate aminotransferase family protein [Chloroflexota bacterium]|nr:alanine--glyoxylate aminotransferase family protein [Chloroflexota bacterium]